MKSLAVAPLVVHAFWLVVLGQSYSCQAMHRSFGESKLQLPLRESIMLPVHDPSSIYSFRGHAFYLFQGYCRVKKDAIATVIRNILNPFSINKELCSLIESYYSIEDIESEVLALPCCASLRDPYYRRDDIHDFLLIGHDRKYTGSLAGNWLSIINPYKPIETLPIDMHTVLLKSILFPWPESQDSIMRCLVNKFALLREEIPLMSSLGLRPCYTQKISPKKHTLIAEFEADTKICYSVICLLSYLSTRYITPGAKGTEYGHAKYVTACNASPVMLVNISEKACIMRFIEILDALKKLPQKTVQKHNRILNGLMLSLENFKKTLNDNTAPRYDFILFRPQPDDITVFMLQ